MSQFNTSSGAGANGTGASVPSPTYGIDEHQHSNPSAELANQEDGSRGLKSNLMNKIANHFLKPNSASQQQGGYVAPHQTGGAQYNNPPANHYGAPVGGVGYGYPTQNTNYGAANGYGTPAATGHSGASGILNSLLHGATGGQHYGNNATHFGQGPTYGTNYHPPNSNAYGGGYGANHGMTGTLINMIMNNPQLRNVLIQLVVTKMSGKPGKYGKYGKYKKRGTDGDADEAEGGDDNNVVDMETQRQILEAMSTEELVSNPDIQRAFDEMQSQQQSTAL